MQRKGSSRNRSVCGELSIEFWQGSINIADVVEMSSEPIKPIAEESLMLTLYNKEKLITNMLRCPSSFYIKLEGKDRSAYFRLNGVKFNKDIMPPGQYSQFCLDITNDPTSNRASDVVSLGYYMTRFIFNRCNVRYDADNFVVRLSDVDVNKFQLRNMRPPRRVQKSPHKSDVRHHTPFAMSKFLNQHRTYITGRKHSDGIVCVILEWHIFSNRGSLWVESIDLTSFYNPVLILENINDLQKDNEYYALQQFDKLVEKYERLIINGTSTDI